MKKCPFCAEEIQDEAVKCKHCGEFLIDAELKRTANVKWYYKNSFIIISVLCLGPLAPLILPLVWLNPNYSSAAKTVVTIAIIVFTLLNVWLFFRTFTYILSLWKQVGQMGLW
jgi:predicted nucleic acid-binding Zn ribbon protein